MSEDGQQGGQTAEQTVAKLFEAAGYEVSQAVGLEPGTVNWFATPRSGLVRPKTYFRVWEQCPEALEPALAALEEARRASKVDRALGVVMEGGLPAGYGADLAGKVTNAITYRRLALEVSGIADAVREEVRQYDIERGPFFYISRRGRTSTGEIVEPVTRIKEWVEEGRSSHLVVTGVQVSGRSEAIFRAAYEIGVRFCSDPESVVPVCCRYVSGDAAGLAFALGFAVKISPDPWIPDDGCRTIFLVRTEDVPRYEAVGAIILENLRPEPNDIERWFQMHLLNNEETRTRLIEARRAVPYFKSLSDALPNINWLLESIMVVVRTGPGESLAQWIAKMIAEYMMSCLMVRRMLSPPAIEKVAILEDAALDQFALGRIGSPADLSDLSRYHPISPALSTWMRVTESPHRGPLDKFVVAEAHYTNILIRDYFLARKLAREVKAGNTELLTRYQFPKEYVLLFLAILSPEAIAQLTADKADEMRTRIETEVERRLQLTLAHQLKRSVGALRLQFKLVRKKIRPEDAESLRQEYARIEEELSFLAALEKQTRLWHEVPNGSPEALSVHEFLTAAAEPLQERHPGVRCDLEIEASLRVRATRGILREILHCLLENAFHASAIPGRAEDPHVRVRSIVEGATVRVEVIDNGAGVAPPDRERIFDPYVTTKKGGEDGALGTGLGLTIARRYAERIGAQVGLDTEQPETCFYARFVIWRDGQ